MLLIYLPAVTQRCEHVFEWIFREELGLEYRFTTDIKVFEVYEQEKINYSFSRRNNEFHIRAFPFLFENGLKKIDVRVEKRDATIILFANDTSCDMGFDIFAAVFYMISRYEEYLPFTPDRYGRYKAMDTLAFRNKFLQQPVVNTWVDLFKNILSKRFPRLPFRRSTFHFITTYDIDIAYAFKGRNVFRLAGSIINDLIHFKFKNICLRVGSLSGIQKDPWDVYAALGEKISRNNLNSIFFFLLADYSKHDKNISYRHRLMKQLVSKLSAFSEAGIHPSFNSSLAPGKILMEKNRLEQLTGIQVDKSRQHYLKFTLPDTYNHLISAGIKEDYSMGFADMPGFRAGTCKPFYFYDVKNEASTHLKIFPVTFMEGTYIDYLQAQPEEAIGDIFRLIEEVRTVNGTFISIWHNHTLSETGMYKGWGDVHNKMIARILYRSRQEV